jgi:uncharacterized membrane protein YbhN (UPF0104 family)
MTRTMLLSLANHVSIIFAAIFIGLGLNITTISPISKTTPPPKSSIITETINYMTIFPIIDGIAAIPATPGGLGTREYATKVMMGHFGVPETRAIPLSLLLYLTTMFWSLVGGVVYAVYVIRSGERPLVTKEASNSLKV